MTEALMCCVSRTACWKYPKIRLFGWITAAPPSLEGRCGEGGCFEPGERCIVSELMSKETVPPSSSIATRFPILELVPGGLVPHQPFCLQSHRNVRSAWIPSLEKGLLRSIDSSRRPSRRARSRAEEQADWLTAVGCCAAVWRAALSVCHRRRREVPLFLREAQAGPCGSSENVGVHLSLVSEVHGGEIAVTFGHKRQDAYPVEELMCWDVAVLKPDATLPRGGSMCHSRCCTLHEGGEERDRKTCWRRMPPAFLASLFREKDVTDTFLTQHWSENLFCCVRFRSASFQADAWKKGKRHLHVCLCYLFKCCGSIGSVLKVSGG